MYFSYGDLVEHEDFPGMVLEILSTAACEEHPEADHEGVLVWHPGRSSNVWVCQSEVSPADE